MTRSGTKRRLALLCVALARAATHVPSASAAEPALSGWAAALGEADRRFVAGDLAGALEVLQPICSTSERPECAFALGAIEHGLGHCQQARVHYRRYRELAPRGEHGAEVEAALEEVETQCGAAPSTSAPVPALPPLTPPVVDGAAGDALRPVGVSASLPPAALLAAPDPLNRSLFVGSLALSGATAVTSVIFGILAARSAQHCQRAAVYDRSFQDECEDKGPRYQGLWQGFAVASGGFLGVGLTLWWLDARPNPAPGVAGAGVPALQYQRSFW